jgi:hypothetical protein
MIWAPKNTKAEDFPRLRRSPHTGTSQARPETLVSDLATERQISRSGGHSKGGERG